MRSTYCLILLFLFYVWFAVLERVHNPFIKYYLDNSLRGNKLIQTWTNLAKVKKNKQKKTATWNGYPSKRYARERVGQANLPIDGENLTQFEKNKHVNA